MNFLYVLGAPGAGKSTLVSELTQGWEAHPHREPLAHIYWWNGPTSVVEMGGRRKKFSGTDVMPLNVQPRAEAFVEAQPSVLILAEGDRLANEPFFHAIKRSGYQLDLVLLATPEETALAWREERSRRLKTAKQDQAWVKGRITKVERLAARYNAHRIETLDLKERVAQVAELSPVASALAGETI